MSDGRIGIVQWSNWAISDLKKKNLGDDECPLAGDELQPTGLGDELRSFMIFLPIFFMSDLDARFVATKL